MWLYLIEKTNDFPLSGPGPGQYYGERWTSGLPIVNGQQVSSKALCFFLWAKQRV